MPDAEQPVIDACVTLAAPLPLLGFFLPAGVLADSLGCGACSMETGYSAPRALVPGCVTRTEARSDL
jgi:hypothetical protein